VGFLARASYALARTPVLALFAAALGAGPEAIGFAVAISTITGIFFKMPAGVLSDVIGRTRTLFIGLVVFAVVPLAYLLVSNYIGLVVVRFLHGFATAVYGPVVMAVVVSVAGNRKAEMLWGVQILVTVFSKPYMGRTSDRLGRQPLLFWGMFACAIPFALIPWFQNYAVLLVLAAVFGVGEAVVTSSAAALVADFCSESNLGSAMGTFGTIFDVGHATGPLLAGFLISWSGGEDFRLSFALISGILILAALAFQIGMREKPVSG